MIKYIVYFSCFYIFSIKITLHNLPQTFLTLLLVVFFLHLWNVDILSSIVSFDYHPLFYWSRLQSQISCRKELVTEQIIAECTCQKIMKYGYGMEWDGTWVWNGMKWEHEMEWNMSMGWNEIWMKWIMEWKMDLQLVILWIFSCRKRKIESIGCQKNSNFHPALSE